METGDGLLPRLGLRELDARRIVRAPLDAGSGRATEGAVVDVDDDLVELVTRIRESEHQGCEILFCGQDGAQGVDGEDPFAHTAH